MFAGKAARAIADEAARRHDLDQLGDGRSRASRRCRSAASATRGFGRIHGDEGIREFTRVKSTAEQVMSIPINMMSFRQPKDMPKRLRGMIKQLYGEGVVAKAGDFWRKLRS